MSDKKAVIPKGLNNVPHAKVGKKGTKTPKTGKKPVKFQRAGGQLASAKSSRTIPNKG